MLLLGVALFAGALVLCLCWSILTHPAPWGSQPLKMKWVSWILVTQWNVKRLGAYYGLWNERNALKSSYIAPKQDRVKEQWTMMAGVPVIIYHPNKRRHNSLALVNFHGGGFYLGSADMFSLSLAHYAEELQALVVSVEYPMQPEGTVQELYESCYRVTTYFIQHATDWEVDPENVVLIGESAGGNIAASTNMRMRDNHFHPMPRLQVLLYGAYQLLDVSLPSYKQNANGPIMNRDCISFFINLHLTHDSKKYYDIIDQNRHVPISVRKELAKDHLNHDFIPLEQKYPPYKPPQYEEVDVEFWNKFKHSIMDPYVSPLIAESHANLSEAIIVSSQYDMLRDESFLYARRLRNAGVPVTFYNDPVGVHAMVYFPFDDSQHSMKKLITVIKSALKM